MPKKNGTKEAPNTQATPEPKQETPDDQIDGLEKPMGSFKPTTDIAHQKVRSLDF